MVILSLNRYEQLLALPTGREAPGGTGGGEKLHSCLTCGKMFTTAEFLQQHIVRKHAQQAGNNIRKSDEGEEEKTAAYPSQLRLFVQVRQGTSLLYTSAECRLMSWEMALNNPFSPLGGGLPALAKLHPARMAQR